MSEAATVVETKETPAPIESLDSITDYRARRAELTGEPAEVAETPEKPVEKPAEGATPEAKPAEAVETEEQKAAKGSLQARIDAAVKAQREAEREAARLKSELEAARKPAGEQPKPAERPAEWDGADPNDPEPDEAKYFAEHPDHTWAQFTRAMTEHTARKMIRVERARSAQEEYGRRIVEAQTRVEAAGKAEYADFNAVIEGFADAGGKYSAPVTQVILEHPDGHRIAYVLAKDPALAERLSKAPNALVLGIEVGRLLTGLTPKADAKPAEKPEPKISGAPPPIPDVRGTESAAAGTPDPERITSVATWRKVRKDYVR